MRQHLQLIFENWFGRRQPSELDPSSITLSSETVRRDGSSADHHTEFIRNIEEGRRNLMRQRQFIASRKAAKMDTKAAEELLEAFERAQRIFEDRLAITGRCRTSKRIPKSL
jgi:hypothetical protein